MDGFENWGDEMKILIVLALSVIMLFGCTQGQTGQQVQQPQIQEQQPTGPSDLAPSAQESQPEAQEQEEEEETGPEEQEVAAEEQEPKRTCSLTLTPDTISAGGSTDIGFSVWEEEQGPAFTYNCGEEILEISSGGLTTGSRLCQFNEVGEHMVWIKADGEICASAMLTVQEPVVDQSCYIEQSSIEKNLETYYYKATVHFEGFKPEDKLQWVCDYTTATKTLGGDEIFGMPLQETISCNYNSQPKLDYIEVSIAGVSCGKISTR